MKRKSPLLFLLLLLFVFSPSLATWMLDTTSAWYRPYIIWTAIVIMSFFIQRSLVEHHDL